MEISEIFIIMIHKGNMLVNLVIKKTMAKNSSYALDFKLSNREIRVLLLHEFHLGCKATEAASNICMTMGKNSLSVLTVQHWFGRFAERELRNR